MWRDIRARWIYRPIAGLTRRAATWIIGRGSLEAKFWLSQAGFDVDTLAPAKARQPNLSRSKAFVPVGVLVLGLESHFASLGESALQIVAAPIQVVAYAL